MSIGEDGTLTVAYTADHPDDYSCEQRPGASVEPDNLSAESASITLVDIKDTIDAVGVLLLELARHGLVGGDYDAQMGLSSPCPTLTVRRDRTLTHVHSDSVPAAWFRRLHAHLPLSHGPDMLQAALTRLCDDAYRQLGYQP